MDQSKFAFCKTVYRRALVLCFIILFSAAFLFLDGCAAFKCGKKDQEPSSATQPSEPVSETASGPVTPDIDHDCSTTQISSSTTSVSVSGSGDPPSGSVVSEEKTEIKPISSSDSSVSQTETPEKSQPSVSGTSAVSSAASPSTSNYPAADTTQPKPEYQNMDTPSGYSGMTQNQQAGNSGSFINVSEEKNANSSGSSQGKSKYNTIREE